MATVDLLKILVASPFIVNACAHEAIDTVYCFYKPGVTEQELQSHLCSKKPSSEVELSMTRALVL